MSNRYGMSIPVWATPRITVDVIARRVADDERTLAGEKIHRRQFEQMEAALLSKWLYVPKQPGQIVGSYKLNP